MAAGRGRVHSPGVPPRRGGAGQVERLRRRIQRFDRRGDQRRDPERRRHLARRAGRLSARSPLGRRRTAGAGRPRQLPALLPVGAEHHVAERRIGARPLRHLPGEPFRARRRRDRARQRLLRAGQLDFRDGDPESAIERIERTLEIRRRALGDEHPDLARDLAGLGLIRANTGDLTGGRRLFAQAQALREKAYGPGHFQVQVDLYNLACLTVADGARDEALDQLRRLVASGWAGRVIFEDRDLDSLRGDPEFEAIVDEVRRRLGEG